jgi:hypothetical protein
MINLRLCGKAVSVRRMLSVLALLSPFSTAALGASHITGSVRNQSRGEPAAGDEVILVRVDRGMQGEARAKTDEHGAFTLDVPHPDKPYLVRVVHWGVSYDLPAFAGDALSIQVFDAATRVRGITGTIEILRTGTIGNLLHVSDLVEIKNESSPPLTQAGERTFDVYLPANAKIDSVLAAGPGKMGATISASSVPGEPGHYTVNFPLRPGATKFAFNYDLPYHGHVVFQTKHAYPLQQFAVMIPPTMKFSSRSPAFKILATGDSRYQVRAANQLQAGEGPGFEVSGAGTLPSVGDQANSQAGSPSPAPPNPARSAPARAALPSLASIDSRLKHTPPPSQSLVLAGVTSILLVACALLVWRARKARRFSAAQRVEPRTRRQVNRTFLRSL